MKRLLLVYNPVSGHAAFRHRLDDFIEAFQRRGCALSVYRTQKEHCALAEWVAAVNPEGIIVAGGDGTLHTVVNRLMAAGIHLPLAVVGSGTSNDFVSALRLNADMEAFFDGIAEGVTRRVDLGRTTGGRCFVNVASAGVMTAIAHEVDARLKNALGKLAYYLRGIGEIPKFRTMPISLVADGKSYEMEAFLFAIINSRVVAGMKNVTDRAKVDDGRLDFLAIQKCSVAELMRITADLLAGRSITEHGSVFHVQARTFSVSAENGGISDLDGERGPGLPLAVETLPRALELYFPARL